MPVISGQRPSFGVALVGLIIGAAALVGIIYAPQYINTSLQQSGLQPVVPSIPQNTITTAIAGIIVFILVFYLIVKVSGGSKQIGAPVFRQ